MKVEIGDRSFDTQPLTYKRLKKAWPMIAVAQTSADPIENMDAAIGLLSLAITPYDKGVEKAVREANDAAATATHDDEIDESVVFSIPYINTNLKAGQMSGLKAAIMGILKENDLTMEKASGEAGAAPAAASTEISTNTFAS